MQASKAVQIRKVLQISKTLSLPLDAVTQSLAILARKRAGKSYLARRFAEELLAADQQVVIIDPKGDWWGIRSSADGKSPGFPVVVLGGEHGDLPLDKTAADTVARLIVEERVSVLLDLSEFRKRDIAQFLGGDQNHDGLLELMYRLKAKEEFRTPLMLIVDEADAIAPQKPFPGEERMLGAMSDIVRRGGQRGLGCMLITQRSSVINKDVLTQTQVMMALRTIAKLDMDAIMDWVNVHGDLDQAKTLKASLPSLPTGDVWVLSPGWPTEAGIFERMRTAPITTFDSGATPRAGEKPVKPKNLADVDLSALQVRMAEAIERKKQNDPSELRRQIAELKKQKPQEVPDRAAIAKVFQAGVDAARAENIEVVKALSARLETCIQPLRNFASELGAVQSVAMKSMATKSMSASSVATKAFAPSKVSPAPARAIPRDNEGAVKLSGAERKILTALAQYPQGRTKVQVAMLAEYAHNGGGFNNALGSLRSRGLITGSLQLTITSEGRSVLGPFEELPTGRDLLQRWLSKCDKCERAILSALADVYPQSLSKIELADRAGYEPSGGGFNNALGRLRTLELINRGAEIRASEDLF